MFDALDLAWLLVASEHLVRVPRVALAARLSQPAASADRHPDEGQALSAPLARWDKGSVIDRRERRMAARLAAER